MSDHERIASTHQSLSELLHAIDPAILIRIACIAGGLQLRRLERIRYRDPRIQVSGLSKRASNLEADLVYTVARRGRVREVWIFEIQLSWCALKIRRWALYELALENEFNAGGYLAVFAPDPALRERIETRLLPRSKTKPIIVRPEHVAAITDYGQARLTPELAILGCLFHAHAPAPFDHRVAVFRAAWIAIQSLADLRSRRYPVAVMSIVAADVVQQGIAELRQSGDLDENGWELFSETERNGHSFWRGREEGREEGRERGKCELLRVTIVDVLELRGLTLTPAQRERIESCASLETLTRWYTTAKTAAIDGGPAEWVDALFSV